MSKMYKPEILNPSTASGAGRVKTLIKQGLVEVVDTFVSQVAELEQVENPSRPARPKKIGSREGLWIYYPWKKCLVRVLKQVDFQRLRTSRNQNLITLAEQKKFERAKIGFAGLNVGNPGAVCVALEGGANYMKMADFDELSLSNLNRFRAGLPELGLNKAVLTARQVYEINPFAEIKMFDQGINPGSEDEFLLKPKLDLLVEEMDNLKLKISIREKAKKHRIPVVMVTGNGAGLILDVERYDQQPGLSILNNLLSKTYIEKIRKLDASKIPAANKVLLARDFMGAKNLTKRLQDSFLLVGSKLAGIPQLAEASFLRGAVLAYAVRRIITGAPLASGRYFLDLEEILNND